MKNIFLKALLWGWLCLGFTSLFAQTPKLKKAELSNFPKIELELQHRNPQPIEKMELSVTENNKSIEDFEWTPLASKPLEKQVVFILFQNSYWPTYAAQRKYFKEVLAKVVPTAFTDKDQLYFTEFDWTNNKGKVLDPSMIINGDKMAIQNAIEAVDQPEKDGRAHEFSEINTALIEAISYLSAIKSDSNVAKSILILSDEVSNIYNSKVSYGDVILAARQKNIPIYAVRFPKLSDKYSLEHVAKESYGSHQVADLENPASTVAALTSMMTKAPLKAAGSSYRLKYSSQTAMGNKVIEVEIAKKGATESANFTLSSPSWMEWLMSSTLRISIALLILLSILGGIFFLIRRFTKKSKQDKEEIEQKIKAQQEENERKLQEQENKFILSQQQKEEQAKEQQFLQEKKKFEQASLERFQQNIRAAALVDFSENTHPIHQPVVSIGRNATCGITLDDKTISREHAYLLFEREHPEGIPQQSNEFYLYDAASGNGSFVNGKKVTGAVKLKDGDQLKFGNISLTFRR